MLLVSEGSHEGHPSEEQPQALRALVRRVLPTETSFEWISVRDLPRGNTLPGKGGGHFKLALKAMSHAEKNGFDALVLITDADGYRERTVEFDSAQVSARFAIPRALGIPVEEFDAWILADHRALSSVLGATIPMLPNPESTRHPKEECQKLMTAFGWPGTQADCYARVCEHMELDFVAQRCPKGFKPFHERLRALLE